MAQKNNNKFTWGAGDIVWTKKPTKKAAPAKKTTSKKGKK